MGVAERILCEECKTAMVSKAVAIQERSKAAHQTLKRSLDSSSRLRRLESPTWPRAGVA